MTHSEHIRKFFNAQRSPSVSVIPSSHANVSMLGAGLRAKVGTAKLGDGWDMMKKLMGSKKGAGFYVGGGAGVYSGGGAGVYSGGGAGIGTKSMITPEGRMTMMPNDGKIFSRMLSPSIHIPEGNPMNNFMIGRTANLQAGEGVVEPLKARLAESIKSAVDIAALDAMAAKMSKRKPRKS